MQWSDEAIVLSARKHGETAAIATLITRLHGRHAGLVRGGAGRRARGVLQPGNEVTAMWRARLAEHLGSFSCELVRAWPAALMTEPLRLAGLSAACALVDAGLPEREPYERLFESLSYLLGRIDRAADWPVDYVCWEVGLLRHLGFGLDLGSCAVTGATEDLAYVSPKSGRAVTAHAAAAYRARLLELPGFLAGGEWDGSSQPISAGLALTGFFLERHVFDPQGMRLPASRTRLMDYFSHKPTISSGSMVS